MLALVTDPATQHGLTLHEIDEPTPREIISSVLPDVLVKGSDWAPGEIVGREEVEAAGGRVASIDFIPGYSTSSIINTVLRNYGKRS